MNGDKLEITVLTWPPLWQYWPAYLAMAQTELDIPVKFILKTPDNTAGPTTDESIRQAFYAQADDTRVIALCEPYDTVTPDARLILRRLPLLWRQPLWILGRNDFFKVADAGIVLPSVWAFPEGTTSGDFTRSALENLAAVRPKITSMKPAGADSELELVPQLKPNEFLASFTPWHLMTDKGRSLTSFMLSGPSSEVTAFVIPDSPDRFLAGDVSASDVLRAQLTGILNQLGGTLGIQERVKKYVDRHWEFVAAFYKEASGVEWPAEFGSRALASALAEYIRLGCYFPYKSLHSAISAEIQKRVHDIFDSAKDRAMEEMQRSMADFLGAASVWEEMGIKERWHAWHCDQDLGPIWRFISHEQGPITDNRAIRHLISEINVSTRRHGPSSSLASVLRNQKMSCGMASPELGHSVRFRCMKETSGTMSPADLRHTDDCAACIIAGEPIAIVRRAAGRLASSRLAATAGYSVGSGRHPCPICFEDIEEIIGLFVIEGASQTGPAGDEPNKVQVSIFNEVDSDQEGKWNSAVLSICWDRPLVGLPASGRTRAVMSAWKDRQNRAGRSVDWVGIWWLNDTGDLRIREADRWLEPEQSVASFGNAGLGTASATSEAIRAFNTEGHKFGYFVRFSRGE